MFTDSKLTVRLGGGGGDQRDARQGTRGENKGARVDERGTRNAMWEGKWDK